MKTLGILAKVVGMSLTTLGLDKEHLKNLVVGHVYQKLVI